jgi:hypothetical protein
LPHFREYLLFRTGRVVVRQLQQIIVSSQTT